MPKIISILAAAAVAAAAAAPGKLAPETPLITDGALVIDAADFEGNMLRIPENRRGEFRASYDRVAAVVDNMYIARTLAGRARELGLDKDPAVRRRLQQVQDAFLADLYVQKFEKEAVPADLTVRAREIYRVDKEKYVTPEQVRVQHILVNLVGRTREAARQRAEEALASARASDDFLSVAMRYSDDPEKTRNGGDLGYSPPQSFTEPVRNALAKLKEGQIAGPVESEYGFHIVKLIDRKPARQLTFEMVAEQIIAAERERLAKEASQRLVQQVRSSPTVVVHRDNVEKLVLPVDLKTVQELHEKARAAAQAAPR